MTLFLDTNVWIDFLIERKPFYYAASTILSLAEEGKFDVAVSSLSMVNANFICCEKAKMPFEIWKHKIQSLKDIVKIYSINDYDIYNSCDSLWNDFEDGVQYFCAKRHDCAYIVTRNQKDFLLSNIKVVHPEEIIDIFRQ